MIMSLAKFLLFFYFKSKKFYQKLKNWENSISSKFEYAYNTNIIISPAANLKQTTGDEYQSGFWLRNVHTGKIKNSDLIQLLLLKYAMT